MLRRRRTGIEGGIPGVKGWFEEEQEEYDTEKVKKVIDNSYNMFQKYKVCPPEEVIALFYMVHDNMPLEYQQKIEKIIRECSCTCLKTRDLSPNSRYWLN